MAVRLQLKLGVVTEHDRLADSPRHPGRGRAERRFRGALEGPPVPAGDLPGRHPARPRGDAAGRRDDPQRVLLRRVGRDPGLPPEGDRDGQQAAGPPGRSAGPQVGRWRRADRRGCRGRARQRDVRRDGRAGRGLPDPPGSPVDPARPASRARAAARRPGAGRLARRGLGWRLARAHLAQHHRQARCRRAQGRDADAPSAVGDGAPAPPLRGRRWLRQRRRDRVRGDRGLVDREGRTARPGPSVGAAGRRARSIADPAGGQRPGRRPGGERGGRQRAAGGRRRPRAGRRLGPGPHAPAQADLPAHHAARVASRDPAPGRPGRPRPDRGRRRARARGLRVREQRLAAGGDQLGERRAAGDRRRDVRPGQGDRSGDRSRRRRSAAGAPAADRRLPPARGRRGGQRRRIGRRAAAQADAGRPRSPVRGGPGQKSTTLFTFAPADGADPIDLRAMVRGPDGVPYVIDRSTRAVYRVDLKTRKATVVARFRPARRTAPRSRRRAFSRSADRTC